MTTTTDTDQLPGLTLDQIEAILLRQGYIVTLWGIEDVQNVRPDLSDEQCLEVLRECQRRQDAEIGISFPIIEMHAADLFPEPASDDEAAEV